MLSHSERQMILDYEVKRLSKEGWQEIERTSTTCKLTKRNNLSGCASLLLFFPLYIKEDNLSMQIKVNAQGVIEHI